MIDKKNKSEGVSSAEIEYIIEVNKKATQVYLEVVGQFDQIIDRIEAIDKIINILEDKIENHVGISNDTIKEIKDIVLVLKEVFESEKKSLHGIENSHKILENLSKRLEDIDKNLFKLIIIISSGIVGTIIDIILKFVKH